MRRILKFGFPFLAASLLTAGYLLLPRIPNVVADAMEHADQYDLLSLDPERAHEPAPDLFQWHRVLGSMVISDRDEQRRINAAMSGAVKAAWQVPRCFNPRHGIRITRNGQTTDLLICFECLQAEAWQDNHRIARWSTSTEPQPLLDELLGKSNIPLARKVE